ncbi:lysis protein [Vibrio cholerae]|nr:lysis protein [Vibrio cholerae]
MKLVTAGVIVAIIIVLYSLFTIEKQIRITAQLERDQAIEQRDSLYDLSIRQVEKIHSFNELSEKHAKELSNAQKEIDRLSDSIRTGKQRVYVKADCPTVSGADKSGSVGDAAAARLTQAAEQDYLRLRQMMVENLQQTKYLQDYIKTQCLVNQ